LLNSTSGELARAHGRDPAVLRIGADDGVVELNGARACRHVDVHGVQINEIASPRDRFAVDRDVEVHDVLDRSDRSVLAGSTSGTRM